MTWYAFNPWFTGEVVDGSPSATPEAPPNFNTADTPGLPRSRWRQWGWAVEPFPEPAPQPVAYAFDADGWFTGEVAVGAVNSTRARPDLLSTTETPGEPRDRWQAGSWTVQTFAPPPAHLSRLAFQLRFPLLPDGVTTKYDACALFLANDGFAASLVPDAGERQALQLLIQTGMNRMGVSTHVDLALDHAALFTGLLMQEFIPELFRLTAPERAAILSTVINESERP